MGVQNILSTPLSDYVPSILCPYYTLGSVTHLSTHSVICSSNIYSGSTSLGTGDTAEDITDKILLTSSFYFECVRTL